MSGAGNARGSRLADRAQPEQVDWLSNLTVSWIESSPELGAGYDWPGNFRELEQCVRNVMVRGEYRPTQLPIAVKKLPLSPTSSVVPTTSQNAAVEEFLKRVRASDLTYDELLRHYCSLVLARSDHLTDAARRLKKHRATVEARIDADLAQSFRSGRLHES